MTTRITVSQPFATASDDSRSMSLTNDLPFTNREMILGSGPMSRSSGPAESGPDCPLPRGGPRGGQERPGRPSPVTAGTPVSVPPTSVPRLAHKPSVHIHSAPNGSAQVSTPGGARALSSPLWHGDLIGLLGPVCRECPKLL